MTHLLEKVVSHHAVTVPCNWYCQTTCKLYLDQHAEIARWGIFVESKSLTSQNWPIQNNFGRDTEDRQKKTEAFTGGIAYDNCWRKGFNTNSTNVHTVFSTSLVFNHFDPKSKRKSTEEKKNEHYITFPISPKKEQKFSLTISTESAGSTNGFPSLFTDLKGHPALVLNTGHSPKPLDAEWRALNISINHFWWSGVNAGILDITSNISLMFFASLKGQLFLNSGHFINSFMMGSSAILWGYEQPSLNAKQWSLMETFSKAPSIKNRFCVIYYNW